MLLEKIHTEEEKKIVKNTQVFYDNFIFAQMFLFSFSQNISLIRGFLFRSFAFGSFFICFLFIFNVKIILLKK